MTKKVCSTCKNEKDLSEFRKDKTQPKGRQTWCKLCARRRQIKYSATYIQKRQDRCQTRQRANTALMKQAKSCGCYFCKEMTIECLDLHHKDPAQKDFALSAYRNASTTKILNEIAKCVVLCANCHRKVHAGLLVLKG